MMKFTFALAAATLTLALAGPASAHCGSCGTGDDDKHECVTDCGDEKNCPCPSGKDCEHGCPHEADSAE